MRNDLSVRLKMIADMASKYGTDTSRVIDVGSDHGQLSVYLLKNNSFATALLTDINEGPIQRSTAAVSDNLLEDRADTMVTDGLSGIAVRTGDVIVMAGMGGNNIRDIIDRFREENGSISDDITFVLQPQKSLPELREWLSLNGLKIVDEDCCHESGFYYCVLCVKYTGEAVSLTDREIYYGPVMLGRFDVYPEYKAFLDRVFEVRARGDKRLKKMLEDEA